MPESPLRTHVAPSSSGEVRVGMVTRFAPSPTGELHVGNVRTALFNALLAWHGGGRFLLRIEDTDAARSKPEFTAALQDDLAWLGIHWHDEPLHQSQRRAVYDARLQELTGKGLAYPCFCSVRELELARATQLASGRPPRYSGKCRQLAPEAASARVAAGEAHTLRFAVSDHGEIGFDDLVHGPRVFAHAEIGDFVLRRADGTAAFFFCNAVDDELSGVTHLLRGDDHLTNTPRQLLILAALGLTAPRYGHLALLTGSDGAPLSKRNGSASVRELRERGFLPSAVRNHLFRLGHSTSRHELLTLEQMASAFDSAHLQRSPAHFDPAQLHAWQKEAAHRLDPEAVSVWLGARLPSALSESARSAFIAAAAKSATGLKGPSLFKPLRAALTGRLAGPELGPLLKAMPAGSAQARLARYASSQNP